MQLKLFPAAKVVTVYAACLVQGMAGALFGASLLDLSELFGTSIAATSALGSTQAASAVLGALLGGPLYTAFNVYILMFLCGVVKGVSLCLVPSNGALLIAHIFFAVYGLTVPFSETGSYNIFVGMQNSAGSSISTIVQGYHLMYALGSFLAPSVVRPFVSQRQTARNESLEMDVPDHAGAATPFHGGSRILMAYIIIGALAVAVASCFCILWKFERSPRHANDVKGTHDAPGPSTSSRRSWILTALTALHAFLYIHIWICIADFLVVYAVLQKIEKEDSLLYISAFYSTFGGFRLLPVILSTIMPPVALLIAVDIGLLLSTACLYFFAHLSPSYLWYCTLAAGATLAPVYGSANGWLLSQEKLSRHQTSTLITASALGAVLPPQVVGRWVEGSPEVFPLVPFVSAGLLMLIMISMTCCSKLFAPEPSSKTAALCSIPTETSEQSFELKQSISQPKQSVSNNV